MQVCCCCLVAKLCPVLCNPMNCIPPDSSVHGISKAGVLELPFPPPGDLPDPGIETIYSALAGSFSTTEPPKKPQDTER